MAGEERGGVFAFLVLTIALSIAITLGIALAFYKAEFDRRASLESLVDDKMKIQGSLDAARRLREDLRKHLSQYFDSPEVAVSMLAYNSKVYYIVTEGANLGDSIVRVPVTGKETVLDAISNVGGISQLSSKNIWIARPAPGDFGCEQILPVDYDAITRGASTGTNYQLMPGDRVFIAEDETVALTNFVNKLTAPFERVVGFTSLTASTIRNVQTLGRAYNSRRRGY